MDGNAQANITRVEYYIDQDPGYGKANALSFTPDVQLANLPINIDPASLTSGVHQVGVRAMDANGKWSLDNRWIFFKPYSNTTSNQKPNLSYAEWYIDTDPGYGKGTAVTVSGTDVSNLLINIDPAMLTNGVHQFGFRSKDANGNWSLDQRWIFFKPYNNTTSNQKPDLTYAEWYIDTAPGYGKGTAVPVSGTDASNVLINIDPATLTSGVHQLAFRSKDANGNWSLDQRWIFFKPYPNTSSASQKPNLAYAEWYIDTDPGYGKGTAVPVSGTDASNVLINIDPATLTSGVHQLGFRAKDANGGWSFEQRLLFFKPYTNSKDAVIAPNIKYIEYYIDSDPGWGKGTPVAFQPGKDIKELSVPVSVSSLPIGNYTLFMRAKDDNGSWSLINKWAFKVDSVLSRNFKVGMIAPQQCAGDTLKVPFTVSDAYGSTNIFTAQLSSINGSFESPRNIGTLQAVGSDTIKAVIPADVALGKGYRIRVVSTQPTDTSAQNDSAITFNRKPADSFTIQGSASTCYGAQVYTASGVTGNNIQYHWELPGGGKLDTAGSQATVTWEASGAHKLKLRIYNECGTSIVKEYTVTVFARAPIVKPVINVNSRMLSVALPATADSVTGYQWYRNDTLIIGATSSSINASMDGSYTIRYTNPCGSSAPSDAVKVGIKSNQVITFQPVGVKTFGDAAFILKATASSALPVSFALISGPAQLKTDTLTITGAGIIIIEATQAGNENYEAASPVRQNITVHKDTAVITFAQLTKVYNRGSQTPIVVTNPPNLALSFTYNGTTNLPQDAGKYKVMAMVIHPDYTGVDSAEFVIEQADQAISLVPTPDKQYGQPRFKIAASVSSGLPVTLIITTEPIGIATLLNDSVTISGVGTVIVNASQQGNTNYKAALLIRDTFLILKAMQTINFPVIPDKTVIDTSFTLSATASSGLPVRYQLTTVPANGVASLAGNTVTLAGDTGIVTIKALQEGDAFYYAADTFRTFKVTPKPKQTQVITFEKVPTKTYGDTAFILKASASSGLRVSFKLISGHATLSGDTIAITSAGNILIEAQQAGNEMYQHAMPLQQNILVQKANQTLRFDSIANHKIGDSPLQLFAKASTDLPVQYQVVSGHATISENQLSINGAGPITVRAYQVGNTNYNSIQVLRTFCVGTEVPTGISGYTKTCASPQTYSIQPIPGATYHWQVSGGGALSASTGNSVTINWTQIGTHTIKLWSTVPCMEGVSDIIKVDVQVTAPIVPDDVTNLYPANGAVIIQWPHSVSWKPSAQAQTYDIYLWVKGSAEPQQPYVSNTDQIGFPLNPYSMPEFGPGKTYNWKVVAKNGCRSSSGVTQTFSITELPNLVIKSVQAPPVAFSGQALDISIMVKNEGKVPTRTSQWTDAVYLSADSAFDWIYDRFGGGGEVMDKYLGGKGNLSALQVGESYSSTIRVNLPENMVGKYYLIVKTNGFRSLTEESDSDNLFIRVLPINLTPPPDLQVTSVVAPKEAFSNTFQTIKYTVKNKGTGVTRFSNPNIKKWKDHIYVSADPVFDINTAVKIGESYYESKMLEPDSFYNNSVQVILPLKYFGVHYIYVLTDVEKNVYEFTFENNNSNRNDSINIFLMPPPDFVLSQWLPPATITAGEKFNINYTLQNQGANKPFIVPQTKLTWVDGLYISKEAVFNAKATPVGFAVPNTYGWPCPPPMGHAMYDGSSGSSSSGGGGGGRASESFVGILYGSSGVRAEADEGTEVPVNVINGNYSWPRYDGVNYAFQGRPIASPFYNSVGCDSTAYPEMLPDESYSITIPGRLPDTLSGTYYLYFFTDITDTVFEYNREKNNIVGVKVEVHNPDLSISKMTAPMAVSSGTTVPVEWLIKNQGQGRVIARTRKDFIWLSTSSKLDTTKAMLVDSLIYNNSMDAGASLPRQKDVKIPDGIQGTYYLFIETDQSNKIFEKDHENNNTAFFGPIDISLTPWPDFQYTKVNIKSDTVVLSEDFTFQFEVQNKGVADVIGKSWKDSVFISNDTTWKRKGTVPVTGWQKMQALMVNEKYTVNANIKIEAAQLKLIGADSLFFLYVLLDDDSSVYEYTGEGNNILKLPLKVLRPDLRANRVKGADSALSGQTSTIETSVTNIGGRTGYWADGWADHIYLSKDTIWDSKDTLAGRLTIRGPIKKDSTYTQKSTYIIPNGISGNYYIFLGADGKNLNEDRNRKNNYQLMRDNSGNPKTMYITLTPPPDLVPVLEAPAIGYSGQPITIKWKVENKGIGPTRAGKWRDVLYLGVGTTTSSAVFLLRDAVHQGDLPVGASYTDSAAIFLPIEAVGNYFLVYKTDHFEGYGIDMVYEHGNEENNTTSSFIHVIRPTPSDLVISDFSIPDSVITGDSISLKWRVRNIGPNPAVGYFKQGIYLSQDSLWNVEDVLLSNPLHQMNLAPLEDTLFSMKVKVKTAAVGKYHIIIRTDLSNNIIETEETNNTTASLNKIDVNVLQLPVNVLTKNYLENRNELYYRVEVRDSLKGETLLVSLKGSILRAANELYIRKDAVPTRDKYDFAYDKSISENQEIVIPTLDSGTYYILVYGSFSGSQEISLLAKKIDFGIHSVAAKEGGNTGLVTVKVKGAKFEPGMQVSLYDAKLGTISSHAIKFVNSTSIFVTFNLAGKDTGRYDLQATNLTGKITTLIESFTILKGPGGGFTGGSGTNGGSGFYCSIKNTTADELMGIDMQHPGSVLMGLPFTITVNFGNSGNVDIPAPTRVLSSLLGLPVAFDMDQVKEGKTELFLEFKEIDGPEGILRPGATGSIVIYTRGINAGRAVYRIME